MQAEVTETLKGPSDSNTQRRQSRFTRKAHRIGGSVRRTSCATCHAEWAPISVWHVSRVAQHSRGIRRRFRSPQSSRRLRLTRKKQAVPHDRHQRLLTCLHLKLPDPQASRHHQQRRVPRPRQSTRFLKSSPSLCDVETSFANVTRR